MKRNVLITGAVGGIGKSICMSLSKKYNLPLIPFLLEGVALDPSLNQQDGIHPNKEGTIKVSETIKKSIINIIN